MTYLYSTNRDSPYFFPSGSYCILASDGDTQGRQLNNKNLQYVCTTGPWQHMIKKESKSLSIKPEIFPSLVFLTAIKGLLGCDVFLQFCFISDKDKDFVFLTNEQSLP